MQVDRQVKPMAIKRAGKEQRQDTLVKTRTTKIKQEMTNKTQNRNFNTYSTYLKYFEMRLVLQPIQLLPLPLQPPPLLLQLLSTSVFSGATLSKEAFTVGTQARSVAQVVSSMVHV